MNKNLISIGKYYWNIKPECNISITPEQYIEYLQQKNEIQQLKYFISTHGYTIHEINNNEYYIEKNTISTEYTEE